MRIYLVIGVACLLSACAAAQKKSDQAAGAAPPKLLRPDVKKIWIPPEIRNGGQEWVEGHYLYRIERNTTWSR